MSGMRRWALWLGALAFGCGAGGAAPAGPGQPLAGIGNVADPVAAILHEPCTADDVCWDNPWPQGNRLRAVWASSAADGWAVGDAGTALHWDGARWRRYPTGTLRALSAVWGSAADDVWAVGERGAVVRWRGRRWEPVMAPGDATLTAVWGAGPSDVWFVGERGVILRWNGRTIDAMAGPRGELRAVWGSRATDVWVGGRGLHHWDGRRWTTAAVPQLDSGTITALWGSGPADVWAVETVLSDFARRDETTPTVLHFDGRQWSRPSRGSPNANLEAVWGRAAGDVWASGTARGFHWDGRSWSAVDGLAPAHAVRGASADDVWAVGPAGRIARWNGTAWATTSRGITNVDLARSPGELRATLYAVSGTASRIWAVGAGGTILRRERAAEAGAWTSVGTPLPFALRAVWVASDRDVWVAGDGVVLRGDGDQFRQVDGKSVRHNAIWGASPDDLWLVGAGGVISHWDGTALRQVVGAGSSAGLLAVAGSSSSDVWAVGQGGTALHWNGATWTASEVRSRAALIGVGVRRSDDAWTVSERGTVYRWDGARWRQFGNGAPTVLLAAICGRAHDDLWAAGAGGALLHWDGRAWASMASGTTGWLHGLWQRDGDEIWTVGDDAAVLRRALHR